ncbi:MAG: hypothetical protein HOO90_04020, partial [Methylotenera sp.]|uniref:M10 family metallopeptidase C-terminal domain-containing protein n=1 Tax=Methylotenera sp. TaxID=2051956 RepID=UPI00184C3398
AAAIDLTTPFPAWVGIEGVVASKSNDTINADATNNFGGSNWLFGGSGNDTITGGLGNDVIVGDGIRLDTLIGTYAGGYNNYLDGASARAAGFVQSNGLLDNVGGGFDKHFTTMLSSATFKDLELGGSAVTRLWRNGVTGTDLADSVTVGDGGTAGAADVVKFTGNRAEYTVEKIIFDTLTKTVVNADGANTVTAYKIIDSVVGRDGADLVVGVENFQFADVTLSALQVSNHAPVIAGGDTATVSFAENSPASVTTIVATDADVPAQTLVYSISGGADAGLFNIDSATGALTFASSPNFEAPTDAGADNVYDVVVEVSDGIATDTQALAVTVTNVDEARTGSVNIVNYTPRPTGNANVVTISAANTIADPDVPALVPSYQWQRSVNNGVTWTDIVGATNATLDNQSNITARVVSTYTDPFGTTTVVSPEMVRVGNGNNNILAANGGNDIVLGLGGNDTLTGNAGNDVVDGGTGNDTINATVNDGDDSFIGGAGTDTYNLSGTAAGATVDLTAGTATSTEIGNDTLAGIERVLGSSAADTFTDGAGVSELIGNNGDDYFILTNDLASDVLVGNAGVDTVDYSALTANLSVILNGNGNVYVNGTGEGFGGLSNRDRISSIENFIGGSGNDIIGGDTLANELSGGNGDDSLRGGRGADVLTGGAGNDLFFYNNVNETTLAARDRIADFTRGIDPAIPGDVYIPVDKIDLSGIDASTAGGNGTFNWLGTTALNAGNADGGLHYYYDSINNLTIVEGSVDTNTTAEFQIELVGNVALTAADFVL